MARREPNTFNYSRPLELALNQLFGDTQRKPGRWRNSAGRFRERKNVSKAVREACRRLRKALAENVIADDRLRVLTCMDLDHVDEAAKRFADKDGTVVDCIGGLISLVGHLLGYEDGQGRPWRHLFYVYTKNRDYDFSLLDPRVDPKAYNKHAELVRQLHEEGLKSEEIATVMNMARQSVMCILVRLTTHSESLDP